MVSFHTDTGLKLLSPLIDGPVNDCTSKVWPYINQVLFQLVDVACALLINMGLEDSPKFCNRPDLGRGYYVARGREKWNQVWAGANTRRWHVHDGQTRCNSADIGLHECAGCHCWWYSIVWIIFMVNYQVMLQEQFDQMALILVDGCESYWP